jgi:hypothetical protein
VTYADTPGIADAVAALALTTPKKPRIVGGDSAEMISRR